MMESVDEITPSPTLEESFYLISKKNTIYRVKLSEKGICLQKECSGIIKTQTVLLEDIVGCRCMRSRRYQQKCKWRPRINKKSPNQLEEEENSSVLWDDSDISVWFHIYAYIIKKGKVFTHKKRDRMVITLRFRSYDRYEDNLKEAQKWKVTLKYLMSSLHTGTIPSCYFLPSDIKIDNKLLVILNPKSGIGKAREVFQSKVVPILDEAEISYYLHCTTHAHDAQSLVRKENLWQYMGGIVVAGGDGILFEVINGLMERPDWSTICSQIKLGIIPCGSGNGLAKSIAHANNEPYDQNPVLVSALNIVHGNCTQLDLVRVETKNQVLFSFLSIGWGLISDVDIESERLRGIGSQRFTIWSVAKLIGLRSYRGRVSYLPIAMDQLIIHEDLDARSIASEDERRDSFYSVVSRKSTYLSVTSSSYESLSEEAAKTFGPTSGLPPLNQSLPPSWTSIEGHFVLVHASYPTHLMTDCYFAPSAKLDDGCIWLCIIRAGISRPHLMQFLVGLSNGSHVKVPEAEMIPVSALRIEPEAGQLTVDGEAVDLGPLQAEILPSAVKVFARG
ncbi:sphingosine kinase 1 [Halyomorpha halys]|uniref:sphingosine kinase 1 n=1 Tax=Halyomorpha halys TaxID=286706 RepID=UPI0006D51017|nr:sphingosine kinase 2 [Halyomorpha halys]XP_014279333.1 sphingosine kinase 2 [Halyomorpha halys]